MLINDNIVRIVKVILVSLVLMFAMVPAAHALNGGNAYWLSQQAMHARCGGSGGWGSDSEAAGMGWSCLNAGLSGPYCAIVNWGSTQWRCTGQVEQTDNLGTFSRCRIDNRLDAYGRRTWWDKVCWWA